MKYVNNSSRWQKMEICAMLLKKFNANVFFKYLNFCAKKKKCHHFVSYCYSTDNPTKQKINCHVTILINNNTVVF